MLIVGLTGGIASGKSTIASMLIEQGAALIDADKIGHEVLEKGGEVWKDLIETFGEDILAEDGTIDRRKLGGKVFGNPDNLAKLNAISHPRMRTRILQRFDEYRANKTHDIVVFDAAILYEVGWDTGCDEVWVVYVPEEVAVKRLEVRNGMTEEQAQARIRSQMPIDEKRARANVVIENDRPLEEVAKEVSALYAEALKRSRGEAPRLQPEPTGPRPL